MNNKLNEDWLQSNGLYRCPYCQKEFRRMGICSHIWRKHSKKGKAFKVSYKEGRVVWNKGLTKDTDDRVNGYAKTLSQVMTGVTYGPLSEKHKTSIRKTINNKVQNGQWHSSFKNTNRYEYISKYAGKVQLHGKWELAYAEYLDSNNIEWRRPKENFHYEFENTDRRYTPDFFLIKTQKYIEIKGYKTAKDAAKWKWFPLKLEILEQNELRKLGIVK